jgi:hypothetical protein
MSDFAILVAIIVVSVVASVWFGMLIARRITVWSDRRAEADEAAEADRPEGEG